MPRLLTVGAGLTFVTLAASIIVPNYRFVANRSSQKRTMADMRTIAAAWEARASDVDSYAVVEPKRPVTTIELARALEPKYIRKLPRVDGWGTEFQLTAGDYDAEGHAATYTIRSLGSDRRSDRADASGATSNFASDIIYSNGSFTQYPESAG
jgi:hypothetical protein